MDSARFDWIGFDADDTLWQNETFFRLTQTGFVDLLADFAAREDIERHLSDTQIRNLELYGYGIKPFVLSMVQSAVELTEGRVSGRAIGQIIELGRTMLRHPLDLIEGAAETVAAFDGRKRILITKGDVLDQERKIAMSGLADQFDRIEIVQAKTPQVYTGIFARHGIDPDAFLMTGNAMRSDVLPVLQAGGHAAHIPHELGWDHEHADDPDHPRFHRLNSISDLPALVHRLEGAG